jgi:hypothetical protein
MCPRHGTEIDGFAIFAISQRAISLIISKAVLHTDDNPDIYCQLTLESAEGAEVKCRMNVFVNSPKIRENNTKA